MSKEKRTTHPAFGMISASRIHHQPEYVFGSDIEHMNTILLRIHHAEQIRNEELHHDKF